MFSDHVYSRCPLAKRSLALDADFLSLLDMHCVVPENIHAHPRKVNRNSKGEGGGRGSKAQVFKQRYDTKMEFPEGWGLQFKKASVGGVWIFSGTTHCTLYELLYMRVLNTYTYRDLHACTCM